MVKYISYTGAYGDVQGTYVSKEDLYSAKEYKSLVTLLAVDDTNDGSYYEEHNMHDSHREDIYLHPILTRHDADEPSYVAPAFWNEKKKKYKNWTLPGADSCIVVPIRCALNVEREPNGGKLPDEKVLSVNKPNEKIPRPAYSWLGFLAIDCADFDVFHNYHDKWLLATVADLLYVLLKLKNSK